jgi:membrane protease YdiL (CAAX protease family)
MNKLLKKHPILSFLAIAYAWTYTIDLIALFGLKVEGANAFMAISLSAFGPAVAGLLVVRARNQESAGLSLTGFLIGAVGVLAACAVRFLTLTGVQNAMFTSPFSPTPASLLLVISLVVISGFIYAHSLARSAWSRAWFASMLPDRKAILCVPLVLGFLPVLLISSNWLAGVLGFDVTEPIYLQKPISKWLPEMFFKMVTVFFLTGGNEEHGWRGVLLPIVQNKIRPIFAALAIGIVWELWHVPLVVAGVYGEGSPLVIISVRLVTTVLFSYLLTFIFNQSSGSIFLCVLMHSCINTQLGLFAGTEFAKIVGALVVIGLIVAARMWRRDSSYLPENLATTAQKDLQES